MNLTIYPTRLTGSIQAIPSKSQAHRLLICSAFADKETTLHCPATNQDIEATARCLNALGATVTRTAEGYHVIPAAEIPEQAVLDCKESGSTLRFMIPIAGALGVDTVFKMSGRLPHRPLSPLWEEMERMGCILSRPTEHTIRCAGKLRPGSYAINGSVSSQFITGLLFAMTLIKGASKLNITGKLESKPYVDMTLKALSLFGVCAHDYQICADAFLKSPGEITVEGDWSNAAFFLAANALGAEITIIGLSADSAQGDRACVEILNNTDRFIDVDASDIPDLVPILAVAAGAKNGAKFSNIQRLRLKESDRVESVASMLRSLGAQVTTTESTMTVSPTRYHSAIIDSAGDHRIAMAAAIAATVADGPVTILDAQCVAKSYPSFWEEFRRLGGNYEQYIR